MPIDYPSNHRANLLKIGEVAALVGITTAAIRSWELLGLVHPQFTENQHRLYSPEDVRLLKRARFLRREHRLSPLAIVAVLKPQNGATTKNQSENTGALLRRLRQERNQSLSDVAAATGISPRSLSAIERSQTIAPVETLRGLASFFKIDISYLSHPPELGPQVVRPFERKILPGGKGIRNELLAWGYTSMEPSMLRVAPGTGSEGATAHFGEEFLLVTRGSLDVTIAGQLYSLKVGDSLYFDSSMSHQWVNSGQTDTLVLWVSTPPVAWGVNKASTAAQRRSTQISSNPVLLPAHLRQKRTARSRNLLHMKRSSSG